MILCLKTSVLDPKVPTGRKNKESFSKSSGIAVFQNESLLMQFILHESLNVMQIFQSQAKVSSRVFFGALIGKQAPPVSWNSTPGPLGKLYEYLVAFYTSFESENAHDENTIKQMLNGTQKALRISMDCHQEIFSLTKTKKSPPFVQEKKQLLAIGKSLQKLLLKKLITYKNDEKILFFLLKLHKEIDAIYEKSTVMPLIKKMFKNGLQEVTNFILRQYAKRGFNHLLPLLRHIMKECEKIKDSG